MDNIIQELKRKDRREELLRHAKCFVLDLDGIFYIEDHILDGSIDFLNQLAKMGIKFIFFTNNSSKNTRFYVERIRRMGYPATAEMMMTSNQVIIRHLTGKMHGKRVYVLGTQYLISDFCDAGINLVEDDPDVVVAGFDTTINYEKVVKACNFIRKGAAFLAVNPDYNCPVQGGFIPDCGSICAMITASTGVKPVYFGKPTPYTLEYVLEKTGLREEEIVFVGDRLYTDIAIGDNNNITTILVLSGETKEEDVINSDIKPKLIFESLKEIKEFMEGLCR